MQSRLSLPIDSIVVEDRQRQDLGDLAVLAASLRLYGLIQPIVITDQNRLIAGGRRLAAAKSLGWTEIEVVYKDTLSPDALSCMELEENIRRKAMTWQEETLAVAKIHDIKKRAAIIDFDKWGCRQTGELLGMDYASVSWALRVAEELSNELSAIHREENFSRACQWLVNKDLDDAVAEQAGRTPFSLPSIDPILGTSPVVEIDETKPTEIKTVYLGRMLYNFDCIPLMNCELINDGRREEQFYPEMVDHIITDPPYGIDMENLDQKDLEGVVAEHDIEENQQLFVKMMPAAFKILRPAGFFVLWCDIMQWDFLYHLAIKAGFAVQRWPLTWVKTSPCHNMAAMYNLTKSTEIAMFCRKPGAVLSKAGSPCVISASNDEAKQAFGHPFVKPFPVWDYIIEHVSHPNQVILDPFAGRGSGVIAALKAGRHCIAIEKQENHFNHLVENVKTHYRATSPNVEFK